MKERMGTDGGREGAGRRERRRERLIRKGKRLGGRKQMKSLLWWSDAACLAGRRIRTPTPPTPPTPHLPPHPTPAHHRNTKLRSECVQAA